MLKITDAKLAGVKIIQGADLFFDHRGLYREIESELDYREAGIGPFVSRTMSISPKNVLRGLHGDERTAKLISCLFGSFYLVAVNCIPGSKQFHQWESFVLTGGENIQVFVPAGFGNGHLILSDQALFHYCQSAYYRGQEGQFTLRWDDPKLGIQWPIDGQPILSERDAKAPDVK